MPDVSFFSLSSSCWLLIGIGTWVVRRFGRTHQQRHSAAAASRASP